MSLVCGLHQKKQKYLVDVGNAGVKRKQSVDPHEGLLYFKKNVTR